MSTCGVSLRTSPLTVVIKRGHNGVAIWLVIMVILGTTLGGLQRAEAGTDLWSTAHDIPGPHNRPCQTQSKTFEEAKQCVEDGIASYPYPICSNLSYGPVHWGYDDWRGYTDYYYDYTNPKDCTGFLAHAYEVWSFKDNCDEWGTVFDSVVGTCMQDGPYDDPPNNCTVGNPCSPATRSKTQTFTDYQAPGINFIRTWRQKIDPDVAYGGSDTESDGRLPRGWTHSYASRVITDGSGDPIALFRPNGAYVTVYETGAGSDIFLTTDGSSVQVRGSGTDDIIVYLPDGSREVYEYHSDTGCSSGLHRLDEVIDAGGRATVVEYSDECAENPDSIVGPFGHTVEINYTSVEIDTGYVDRIDSIEDASGHTISYDYVGTGNGEATGQLEYVTYQDSTVVQYHYDDEEQPGYLSGITDELGERFATFTYDVFGQAAATTHADGYGSWDLEYAYGEDGATATDANDVETTFEFQNITGFRRIIGSITRDGATRTFDNETSGQYRLLELVDENDVTTTYAYDTYHRTSKTEADGETEERLFEYDYLDDTSSRLTSVESDSVYASGTREVATTYDGNDLPETITISGYTPTGTAVSRVVTFDYNGDGQVIEIDGPRTDVSDVTTLDYYDCTTGDECGQLESVTNALSQETTFDYYDDHGHLTQMTDPNNIVTTYTYDLRGRVLTITETPPSGPARVTTYTYDDAGQLETAEAPNGTELTYAYDDAHNLVSITDNDGNTIQYGYDLAGNLTDEDTRDPYDTLTKALDYTYDAHNRIESINAAGSVTDLVFDAVGNLTDETDPNDNDTGHDFDPLNRLAETLDALSGTTSYEYDVNDYPTSVEAPNGATTTYVYDDLGNLLSMSSPDTGTTTYTYDAAGNVLTQTDANSVTTTYTYDELNRVETISYPNSSLDVTFTYDAGTNQKGRLTTMADGSGTTTYSYDVYGNLTQESKVIDSNTYVTSYTYDAADLLSSITYPSGRTVDYTRDALGQIEEVDTTYGMTTITVADDVTYEPFGPLNGLTLGNSLALSRTFDTQYRLTDQTTGSIQDLDFTYDAAGNVDAIGDNVDSSLDQAFTQDDLHRIDSDSGDYGDIDYTYDANGNRLTKVVDTVTDQTLTYTTDTNQLATHNGNTVTLDYAGNTTADVEEALSFTYDDNNRMVEAYVSSTLQASYVYNGQGQRVKKVEATGDERTFLFHYGPSGELIGETIYDDMGAKIGERDYIWLDDLPVAQSEREFSGMSITSDVFVYLHADQLNTPRLATDGSGDVVWRWDSDAFGVGDADLDPDSDTNDVNVHLRFPGQYFDEETGLSYNYYRDYDPVVGRYVQSDPVGLEGGLNPYLYANGNPLAYADPYGLWSIGDPLPQGLVDSVTGFGDAFLIPELIRDAFDFGTVDECSAAYKGGKITGIIWGAIPFAARTAAAVGATRFGRVLNANRYFRIGPGRWGKDMLPRISSPYLPGDGHYLLTTRLPMLPPAGVVSRPDCGCGG